ncbi:5-hydroxytryptamine receptor 3A [Aplysia californica]|uniref:5-hydroxytryptamine receptor 3A n=1 Tax=Aplysia californica TaxID=6500 RepID=A0ABM0JH77_APLCA|nr:5-hydroxytryptamine receptor 3A [Aplysia californica]
MDMEKFPMDTQVCSLVFDIPSSYFNDVTFGSDFSVINSFHKNQVDWLVKDINIGSIEEKAIDIDIIQTILEVRLALSRQPYYYIVGTIIPLIFLSCLNPFAFLLPVDHGERISFSVSLLLSYAVTLASLTDMMPSSSSTVCYISILSSVSMFTSVSIALLVIITARVATWEGQSTNRQLWTFLAKFVCWKKINRVNTRGDQSASKDNKAVQRKTQHVEREQNESLFRVLNFEDGKEKPAGTNNISQSHNNAGETSFRQSNSLTWYEVAFIMNRVAFFVTSISTIFFVTVVMLMISL